MTKLGKRMREALEKVEVLREYELMEAVTLAKETAQAKFDESMDVAVRLGVDRVRRTRMFEGVFCFRRGLEKSFAYWCLLRVKKRQKLGKLGQSWLVVKI